MQNHNQSVGPYRQVGEWLARDCWCLLESKCQTTVILLFMFTTLTYIIHQRRLLYWKKCLFSDNVLLQTLARCCHDNIGSLCDIYKLAIKTVVDSPKYLVKELFWREFERSHILW